MKYLTIPIVVKVESFDDVYDLIPVGIDPEKMVIDADNIKEIPASTASTITENHEHMTTSDC